MWSNAASCAGADASIKDRAASTAGFQRFVLTGIPGERYDDPEHKKGRRSDYDVNRHSDGAKL